LKIISPARASHGFAATNGHGVGMFPNHRPLRRIAAGLDNLIVPAGQVRRSCALIVTFPTSYAIEFG
jgi:hypothetical protein